MTNEEYQKRMIRHGEVVIVPIDAIPKGVVVAYQGKEYTVGHSESGHHHVAVGELPDAMTVFKPAGADSQELYLRVSGPAHVEHRKSFDTHETKPILPGDYIIEIAQEFDYTLNVVRMDMD